MKINISTSGDKSKYHTKIVSLGSGKLLKHLNAIIVTLGGGHRSSLESVAGVSSEEADAAETDYSKAKGNVTACEIHYTIRGRVDEALFKIEGNKDLLNFLQQVMPFPVYRFQVYFPIGSGYVGRKPGVVTLGLIINPL